MPFVKLFGTGAWRGIIEFDKDASPTIEQGEEMYLVCNLHDCRTLFVTSRSMAWSSSWKSSTVSREKCISARRYIFAIIQRSVIYNHQSSCSWWWEFTDGWLCFLSLSSHVKKWLLIAEKVVDRHFWLAGQLFVEYKFQAEARSRFEVSLSLLVDCLNAFTSAAGSNALEIRYPGRDMQLLLK